MCINMIRAAKRFWSWACVMLYIILTNTFPIMYMCHWYLRIQNKYTLLVISLHNIVWVLEKHKSCLSLSNLDTILWFSAIWEFSNSTNVAGGSRTEEFLTSLLCLFQGIFCINDHNTFEHAMFSPVSWVWGRSVTPLSFKHEQSQDNL